MPIVFFMAIAAIRVKADSHVLNLSGPWEAGENRQYERMLTVPGLATNPAAMNNETLWYKRRIRLPAGPWRFASLILKGANFAPSVYVNGQRISERNGGMAPTVHLLSHSDVKPDSEVVLEIALKSLKDLPPTDASYVATANHWRSNVSSCLWDEVVLKTHGDFRISRMIPFTSIDDDQVAVHWEIENLTGGNALPTAIHCALIDSEQQEVASGETEVKGRNGVVIIPFNKKGRLWSPEHPRLYRLHMTLNNQNGIVDQETISYGIKSFRTGRLDFRLNGESYPVRAGTVVWHRWIRDPEARTLAWDTTWFKIHVLQRLKDHGSNTIRFHLGNPPEAFLDLCDRYGMLVQYEWSFFHGMPASEASLLEQWRIWLDLAMRHPSVSIIHPYNETEGSQLDVAWSALNRLLADYPPLVLADRDVIHVHKYWWSMFENVGLYYDSAAQFSKPIMVDEFGGNYLDGNGVPGGYPSLKRSYLRFLGKNQTAGMRLDHHTLSNSQIAEYWRRLGAAGFSPFCIAGSWEDGNHWFLGPLVKGNPKPVWDALTAAFSPLSVSLEIWDRNFVPFQRVNLPVYFFNDTEDAAILKTDIRMLDSTRVILQQHSLTRRVPAHGRIVARLSFTMPSKPGRYSFEAVLNNPPEQVKYPVVSRWDFRVFKAEVPNALRGIAVGISTREKELRKCMENFGIHTVGAGDPRADILLGSSHTWEQIEKNTPNTISLLESSILRGKPVLLLDAGPKWLGQGYPKKKNDLGPLQKANRVINPEKKDVLLLNGVKLRFQEIAEPESHIHPVHDRSPLWYQLEREATWLWNGLRGGLIAPAGDMTLTGLRPSAFISQWTARGAAMDTIQSGRYFAYALQGFYAFSSRNPDQDVQRALRDKVRFLVQDAPSLANAINPEAEMNVTDLAQGFRESEGGKAEQMIPLVNCGNDLSRNPAVLIRFGEGQGNMIVSQLLTSGRLAEGFGQPGLYGVRYDEVAVQFVLNMMRLLVENEKMDSLNQTSRTK